ncbi:lipopolysaccharide biosynthesis protein [Gordonia rubripertincta]|uniref:lipopolysaccharide biosynthesis protein n=1 Tax=Gordonia rubripertincta TaxID=36822 RepID=UPI000B8D7A9A|nr:hypothetical protein [Gordonia rubripertincta]ASR01956.1 Polysaccharide biosynthesis protein [Gordonia rubripertincta]
MTTDNASKPRLSLRSLGGFVGPALLQKVIPFVALPILAHSISVAELGLCGVLTTIFLLGNSVFGFGQDTIMFSQSKGRTVSAASKGIVEPYAVLLVLNIAVCVVVSCAIAGGQFFDAGVFYYAVLIELAAASVYSIGYMPFATLTRINYEPTKFAVLVLAFSAVQYLTKLVLIPGSEAPALVWALTDLASATLVLLVTVWNYGSDVFRTHWLKPVIVSSAVRGFPLVPSKIAQWFQTSSDRLMISHINGPVQAGQYAAAGQFTNAALGLIVEVSRYFTPSLSEYARNFHSCGVFDPRIRRVMLWQAMVMSAGAGLMAVAGPMVVAVLFPKSYEPAQRVVAGLAGPVLLAGLGFVAINFVTVSLAKTGRVWVWTTAGALASVLVNVALLRALGLAAAVIASSVGYGIVLAGVVLTHWTEFRKAGAVTVRVGSSVAISCITVVASVIVYKSVVALSVVGCVAGLLFVLLIISSMIGDPDRDKHKHARTSCAKRERV